jgi:hypothetical protein
MATAPEGKFNFRGCLMDIPDAIERLHRLPPNATLTSAEAALFLAINVKTLERRRTAGTGPRYIQGGAPGARGTNQACFYHVKDLLDWQESQKVGSSMEAAVRKGQAFATIEGLAEERPFYVNPWGEIEAQCDTVPLDTVIERLGAWDIQFLSATDAASRPWSSLSAHRAFAEEIQKTLKQALGAIEAGLEATEIGEGLEKTPPKLRRQDPL